MKKRSAFRFLPVSIVLALLMLAVLPSTTLAADRSIRVFPDEAAVGGKVEVRGDDYDFDYPPEAVRFDFVFVTVYFTSEEAEIGDRIGVDVTTYAIADGSSKVDEFGRFQAGFRVPDELADGSTFGDVEEGLHYVYVTYWNDDVIVAANVLEVSEVPDQFFFPREYPPSSWRSFPSRGCWPRYDDEPAWDGIPYYPFWWRQPGEWPDDWSEDWPGGWPGGWPYGWSLRHYYWHPIPIPQCGC